MSLINWDAIPSCRGKPDFKNLLAVLDRKIPMRPTLFEFYLNNRLYTRLVPGPKPSNPLDWFRRSMLAYHRLGYDYAMVLVPGLHFQERLALKKLQTLSLNEGALIRSREDFDRFSWPDPAAADYAMIDQLAQDLPRGMKLVPLSNDGLLENVIKLVGLETLCIMVIEDWGLAQDIFNEVGSRLVSYYREVVRFKSVGACMINDDWGFKTSTMFSPEMMRQLVFPWHRRMVDQVHAAGKPAILHSCGHFESVMEDIIDDIGFDGRHSYEDAVMPVEDAYEKYHGRLAILGGIDMNFISRSTPREVYRRAKGMLDRTAGRGGYALGTGNSVPEYVPDANYFAMVRAALEAR